MNNSKINIAYLLILVLPFIYVTGFSQTVKAGVDRDNIFIGEQILLKLSVKSATPGMKWFNLPDSINHLEIVNRGKIDTVKNGIFNNYSQTIAITSFDSGRWELPALQIKGVAQATAPIIINVSPVNVENLKDYHDIKDIEEVTGENNWFIIGIIAAITLLSIGLVVWLIKKKKIFNVPGSVANGNLSPLDWAMAELNKIRLSDKPAPEEVKKYYSSLTNISRVYFQRQLQKESRHQTSDEWMIDLQALSVDTDTKTLFYQFLRLSDTVKFARYLPPATENENSIESVKNMLQKSSLLHSNLYSKYQPK